jgi:hypothetical protein
MPSDRTDRSSHNREPLADPPSAAERLIRDLGKSWPHTGDHQVNRPATSPPSLAERLKAASRAAPERCFELTPEAEGFWATAVRELMTRKPWLFERGVATARAYIIRLATPLAVDACVRLIGVTHVEAAVAFWEYSSPQQKHGVGPLQLVDGAHTSTVFWHGRPAVLRSRNSRGVFRLLYRAYRAGSFVHRDVMCNAFRQTDISPEMIRQAVCRLRKQLIAQGLDEVAAAIKPCRWNESGTYVLRFEQTTKEKDIS